jgi:biotin--protein ligase
VGAFSFKQTVKWLKKHKKKEDTIKSTKAAVLENDLKTAHLLVIPGGQDVYYHKALSPKHTLLIKKFVEQGGRYLGICAGGYFGAHAIEFEKGHPYEVIANRDLQFFPKKAVGSALGLGKYRPDGFYGADIATIITKDQVLDIFFLGGCYFEKTDDPNVEVIAKYEHGEDAVVKCQVSKGVALLSGVHFEYSADDLKKHFEHLYKELKEPFIAFACAKIEQLKRSEAKKEHFFDRLLDELR